jgi:trans-aconitate methyltransferase
MAGAGVRVMGIDLSERQVERARRLVPQTTFMQADATSVVFAMRSSACTR